MSRDRYTWLLVDPKRPNRPLFAAPTAKALAEKCGVHWGTVTKDVFEWEHGRLDGSRYRRVKGRPPGSWHGTGCSSAFYWIEVTRDKYELPLGVYDSVHALSRATGQSVGSIRSQVSRFEHGRQKKCRFRRVLKV